MRFDNILVRAPNWVGDAVMSLPALGALRERFPGARISIVVKPFLAGLYRRERFADETIPYSARTWADKLRFARSLRARRFDAAILLQNAFEAALIARVAAIPVRIGYDRDARRALLTTAVPVPKKGEIPPHERFYYLELLRRAGILDALPAGGAIRLDGAAEAAAAGRARLEAFGLGGAVVGVSPGAAYGDAKRWLPERFAEAAVEVARRRGAAIALFGSKAEHALCDEVAARVAALAPETVRANLAGRTELDEFIECAAACEVFLTNDSGAMHIASALGVPTVAVFGSTDDIGTGPTGPLARVVRQPVSCSPCLLRECPIDHRCMTGVAAARVAETALELLQ